MTETTADHQHGADLTADETRAARRWRRPRLRLPIALALAAFIAITFLPFVAITVLTANNARDAAYHLMADRTEMLIEGAATRLTQHLRPVEDQGRHLATSIQAGLLDPTDRDAMHQALVHALSATSQVRDLGYLNPEGLILRVNRNGRQATIRDWSDDPETQANLALARSQPALQPFWAHPFYAERTGLTNLNLFTPLWQDGRFLGLLVAVVGLQDLRSLVSGLNLADFENAYIRIGDRYLLAHSWPLPANLALSDRQPLPYLEQVGDPVLTAIADPAAAQPAPSDMLANLDGFAVEAGGQTYLVVEQRITGTDRQPWRVGAYALEGRLVAPTDRILLLGGTGVIIAAISLFAILAFGRSLTESLKRLAGAARSVRAMDLDGAEPPEASGFRELDDAATAFRTMLGGLKAIRTYVPDRIVTHLMANGDDSHLKGEERDVTVLFTDIAGFSTLAEHWSAAQVASFLNEHFSLIAGCIAEEGGCVDKYIGDSLMAFWGAPDRQPDHAERAMNAALAIASAIRTDNRQREAEGRPTVRIRVGLHTGPVVVGNIGAPGRVNYTVVGDTVNTAQRIESLAKSEERCELEASIVVSQPTVDALGGGLDDFTFGKRTLRGRGEPIEVYLLR